MVLSGNGRFLLAACGAAGLLSAVLVLGKRLRGAGRGRRSRGVPERRQIVVVTAPAPVRAPVAVAARGAETEQEAHAAHAAPPEEKSAPPPERAAAAETTGTEDGEAAEEEIVWWTRGGHTCHRSRSCMTLRRSSAENLCHGTLAEARRGGKTQLCHRCCGGDGPGM